MQSSPSVTQHLQSDQINCGKAFPSLKIYQSLLEARESEGCEAGKHSSQRSTAQSRS